MLCGSQGNVDFAANFLQAALESLGLGAIYGIFRSANRLGPRVLQPANGLMNAQMLVPQRHEVVFDVLTQLDQTRLFALGSSK